MAESDKRSPVFDWEKGDFVRDNQNAVVTVTEGEAMKQIALKALHTRRGVYLIYADVDDEELHHKYGNDMLNVLQQDVSEEVRLSELKRAGEEALIYDPWVTEVYEIDVSREPGEVQTGKEFNAGYISLKVNTIFDRDITLEGVNLNG